MSLWPFKPANELIEVLEWKTDVLRSLSAEQRMRLRERPRRSWNFSHVLSNDEQSAARAIIRGSETFKVPDWIKPVYIGSVSAGTSVSITVSTTGLGLSAGASVVLWKSQTDNEVCVIESVSPTGFVLEYVANPKAGAWIYRCDDAYVSSELKITKHVAPVQFATISFDSAAVDVYSNSTYTQYRGHDVLPVIPLASSDYDETLNWDIQTFDNGSGLPSASKSRTVPDEKFMMRWRVFTDAEIQAVRAWVSSRCGRWLAFWQSTWTNDLTVAADIGASATTLRVYVPSGATSLGRTSFDLEIGAPTAVYRRRVTSVSAGPLVNGRPTEDLTLDSAIGTAVSAAAFGRISFLRCARFDADRIELLHRPGEGLAVAVPCIEVPVP